MPKALLLATIFLVLHGCGTREEPVRGREGAGGRYYGGVFNMNEGEQIRSFFPLSLSQAAAHRIAAQFYQGLVRLDPNTLEVRPCLAESWEIDPTGLVYTFHLRKGVRFHDDAAFPGGEGRLFTAHDVAYCYKALCTYSEANQMFWLFQDRVAGADELYASTRDGTAAPAEPPGFEVLDDHRFRITLEHPTPNFLQVLAHQGCWIYPHELVDGHGDELQRHAIGTGPFAVRVVRSGEVIVLERFPGYWEHDEQGNQLPFLDAVRVTFVPDKNKELEEFLKGRLTTLFELPVERVAVLGDSINAQGVQRFVVRSTPGLTTQFYGFNLFKPPFNDLRVRRAFAMAIDRVAIVDSVLRGLAIPALHGLVSPGLAGYPYEEVHAQGFDPAQARALLAEAGFPGGRGFPPVRLQVNGDGFGYVEVAEAVQSMIEDVLGVSITISVLHAEQHYDLIERGQASFWREGWIADYPDPENFLALLYGKNAVLDTGQRTFLNNTRFADPVFDSLFVSAQTQRDAALRAHDLAHAEDRAMSQAPILPLYHDRNIRLEQPWVRDLPVNGMEFRDLGRVWFDPLVKGR